MGGFPAKIDQSLVFPLCSATLLGNPEIFGYPVQVSFIGEGGGYFMEKPNNEYFIFLKIPMVTDLTWMMITTLWPILTPIHPLE